MTPSSRGVGARTTTEPPARSTTSSNSFAPSWSPTPSALATSSPCVALAIGSTVEHGRRISRERLRGAPRSCVIRKPTHGSEPASQLLGHHLRVSLGGGAVSRLARRQRGDRTLPTARPLATDVHDPHRLQ